MRRAWPRLRVRGRRRADSSRSSRLRLWLRLRDGGVSTRRLAWLLRGGGAPSRHSGTWRRLKSWHAVQERRDIGLLRCGGPRGHGVCTRWRPPHGIHCMPVALRCACCCMMKVHDSITTDRANGSKRELGTLGAKADIISFAKRRTSRCCVERGLVSLAVSCWGVRGARRRSGGWACKSEGRSGRAGRSQCCVQVRKLQLNRDGLAAALPRAVVRGGELLQAPSVRGPARIRSGGCTWLFRCLPSSVASTALPGRTGAP